TGLPLSVGTKHGRSRTICLVAPRIEGSSRGLRAEPREHSHGAAERASLYIRLHGTAAAGAGTVAGARQIVRRWRAGYARRQGELMRKTASSSGFLRGPVMTQVHSRIILAAYPRPQSPGRRKS